MKNQFKQTLHFLLLFIAHCCLCGKEGTEIFIRTHGDQGIVAIPIQPGATVNDVIISLCLSSTINVKRCELTFGGASLSPNALLSDEGIGAEAVLDVKHIDISDISHLTRHQKFQFAFQNVFYNGSAINSLIQWSQLGGEGLQDFNVGIFMQSFESGQTSLKIDSNLIHGELDLFFIDDVTSLSVSNTKLSGVVDLSNPKSTLERVVLYNNEINEIKWGRQCTAFKNLYAKNNKNAFHIDISNIPKNTEMISLDNNHLCNEHIQGKLRRDSELRLLLLKNNNLTGSVLAFIKTKFRGKNDDVRQDTWIRIDGNPFDDFNAQVVPKHKIHKSHRTGEEQYIFCQEQKIAVSAHPDCFNGTVRLEDEIDALKRRAKNKREIDKLKRLTKDSDESDFDDSEQEEEEEEEEESDVDDSA